jgi:hypothetical protein
MKPNSFEYQWNRAMQSPANRAAYRASRAWQLRKQAVGLRARGRCERCRWGRYEECHHLTNLHYGAEYVAELMALCRDCHAYLHGHSAYDPVQDGPKEKQGFLKFD